MFQFASSHFINLCIQLTIYEHLPHMGSPIRKSAGQWIFAPYRSLSQLVTSFIGNWCQGIRPALLVT